MNRKGLRAKMSKRSRHLLINRERQMCVEFVERLLDKLKRQDDLEGRLSRTEEEHLYVCGTRLH